MPASALRQGLAELLVDDDAELGEEPTQGFSAVDPSGAEDRGFTVRVGGETSATEKFLSDTGFSFPPTFSILTFVLVKITRLQ